MAIWFWKHKTALLHTDGEIISHNETIQFSKYLSFDKMSPYFTGNLLLLVSNEAYGKNHYAWQCTCAQSDLTYMWWTPLFPVTQIVHVPTPVPAVPSNPGEGQVSNPSRKPQGTADVTLFPSHMGWSHSPSENVINMSILDQEVHQKPQYYATQTQCQAKDDYHTLDLKEHSIIVPHRVAQHQFNKHIHKVCASHSQHIAKKIK